MSINALYKELYSLAKGNVINEFLLVRLKHFTDLLSKYKIKQYEIEDCILKVTKSNVYISTEELLNKLPEEANYLTLVKVKGIVLKRLPSFIKGLVDSIPLKLTNESSHWSIDEIAISTSIIDIEQLEILERSLGQIYWLLYEELTAYEDIELLSIMGSLACKELTINKIGTEAGAVIDKLYQYAKFNKVKALIKMNNENSVLLELFNINSKCKENS